MKFNALIILISLMLLSGCAGQAFNKAKEINTVEAYDKFLTEFGTNIEFTPKVKKLREKAFFDKISKINTVSSFYHLSEIKTIYGK